MYIFWVNDPFKGMIMREERKKRDRVKNRFTFSMVLGDYF